MCSLRPKTKQSAETKSNWLLTIKIKSFLSCPRIENFPPIQLIHMLPVQGGVVVEAHSEGERAEGVEQLPLLT